MPEKSETAEIIQTSEEIPLNIFSTCLNSFKKIWCLKVNEPGIFYIWNLCTSLAFLNIQTFRLCNCNNCIPLLSELVFKGFSQTRKEFQPKQDFMKVTSCSRLLIAPPPLFEFETSIVQNIVAQMIKYQCFKDI